MMALWQLTYCLGIGILFNWNEQAGESRGSGSNCQRRKHGLFLNGADVCYQ
jgi:hypothetical protein